MANVKAKSPDVSGKKDVNVCENPTQKGGRNTPTKGDKPNKAADGSNHIPVSSGKNTHAPADREKVKQSKPFDNVPNFNLITPKVPDLLSVKDFEAMCAQDNRAKLYSGKPDSARVAINLWLHMARDISPLLCAHIKDVAIRSGLKGAISHAGELYRHILDNGWASLSPVSYPWISECTEPETQARLLCVLQFLKRYTYGLADMSDTIRTINRSLPKNLDITDFRWHLSKSRPANLAAPHTVIWAEMKEILRPFDDHFKGLSWDDIPMVYSIPKGSAHDVCNCVLCKTLAAHNIEDHGYSRDYALPGGDTNSEDSLYSYIAYEYGLARDNTRILRKPKHKVYAINVPKELGVSRVICPEDIKYYIRANSVLQWVYTWLWDYYPYVAFDDQSRAEINAYSGSLYGDTFTKDCSGASDRIPRVLVKELLPNYYSFVESTLSSTIVYSDGTEDELRMFATSGHPLTYLTESMIYDAACEWALKTYTLWAGSPDSIAELVIIGDDTSGPTEISDLVSLALQCVFAKVNEKKSYDSGHPFRESCGYDYWKGFRVPPIHWPRKDMADLISCSYNTYTEEWESPLSSLVALVSGLDTNSFSSAANYLAYHLASYGFVFAPVSESTQPVARHGKGGYRLFGVLTSSGKPKDLYVAKAPVSPLHWMFATSVKVTYHTRKAKRDCICASLPTDVLRLRYERILYDRFLEFGPRYATALDELLHVSEPEIPFSKASSQVSFTLVLTPVRE